MLTREEAKRLSELYSAVAEGKAIQMRSLKTGKWVNVNANKNDIFSKDCDYRIKPKPKYRSFKNQEECWQEMLKHQPFGWIRNNITQYLFNIHMIGPNNYGVIIDTSMDYYDRLFSDYNFVDDTPFGIKDE